MYLTSFNWDFKSGSSTGAHGTILNSVGLRLCRNFTVQMICEAAGAGGTCSIGIEVGTDSTSGFARMGSTKYDLSSGSQQVYQWSGPVEAIRPYLVGRTDSNVFARVILHGN